MSANEHQINRLWLNITDKIYLSLIIIKVLSVPIKANFQAFQSETQEIIPKGMISVEVRALRETLLN